MAPIDDHARHPTPTLAQLTTASLRLQTRSRRLRDQMAALGTEADLLEAAFRKFFAAPASGPIIPVGPPPRGPPNLRLTHDPADAPLPAS